MEVRESEGVGIGKGKGGGASTGHGNQCMHGTARMQRNMHWCCAARTCIGVSVQLVNESESY
jgi:hypothetical protein